MMVMPMRFHLNLYFGQSWIYFNFWVFFFLSYASLLMVMMVDGVKEISLVRRTGPKVQKKREDNKSRKNDNRAVKRGEEEDDDNIPRNRWMRGKEKGHDAL